VKRDKRTPAAKVQTAKPPIRAPWDRRHLLVGIVLLLALVTYSNSFRAPFLMDNAEIPSDTRLHQASSDNVDRIIHGSYHQAMLSGLYRPLTLLSYMYNYAVRGDGVSPEGWHWFNFELHAVNILLVYLLGWLLFADIPAALALAALWGLHPVLTEGVTNLVGRADALAAFGTLAAVVAYAYSLRREGWQRWSLVVAIALATLVGSFSKESGVVAVAAVIAYDIVFEWNTEWRRRIPGLVAVASSAAFFLLFRASVMSKVAIAPFPYLDNPIVGAGFVAGRMTAFKVIAKYLGLLVFPMTLSPDYSYNEIPVSGGIGGVVGLLLCLGAGALALWAWRQRKALAFAILFFFVTLAPVSNIFLVIGSIMGERFLYLPSIGFMAAVVYGLHRLWLSRPAQRKAIACAVGIVALVFLVRAHARNEDWNDERRFWQSALAAAPGSFKTRLSWAGVIPRTTQDGWTASLDEVQKALAIIDSQPDDRESAFPYRNAGILYRQYGDFLAPKDPVAARSAYQRSLELLLRSERIEKAQAQFNQKLNMARGLPQSSYLPGAVYRELGTTYLKLNDLPRAMETLEFGRNLESDPDLLENLGAAYQQTGELPKAALALVEALEMDGKRSYLAGRIVGVYRQMEPAGCAVGKDGALDITCPRVHNDICTGARNVIQNYTRRQQPTEAASIRRVATQELGCPASALE
jgi:hypothetical protein